MLKTNRLISKALSGFGLLVLVLMVSLPTPTAATDGWTTFTDKSLIFQYPTWDETEPTRIEQTATGASATIAVNYEGFCAFTMAYEPKGITGAFKSVIPARLSANASSLGGSVLYSKVNSTTFESQIIYPYFDGGTNSTLVQYTYGVRTLNGDAYYLGYTSDINNFEGGCKQIMFATMASVQLKVSATEKVDAKTVAAYIKNPYLGRPKSSKSHAQIKTTTFKNKQQLCFNATLKKTVGAKTMKLVSVNAKTYAQMYSRTVGVKLGKGSMSSCSTVLTSITPAGKYQLRVYINNKLVSKLGYTVK